MDNSDFEETAQVLTERLINMWVGIEILLLDLPIPIAVPDADNIGEEVENVINSAVRSMELVMDQPIPYLAKAAIRTLLTHWLAAETLIGGYIDTQEEWRAIAAHLNLGHGTGAFRIAMSELAYLFDED